MLHIPEPIKNLISLDGVLKNFRVVFPNGEHSAITNDNIIKESVKFSESLCSQNYIKFGLCESSCLRFSCVNVPNITGVEFFAYIDIDITSLPVADRTQYATYTLTHDGILMYFYEVPLGRFKVESSERDANMMKRNIIAYSVDTTFEPLQAETYKQNKSRSTGGTLSLNVLNYCLAAKGHLFDMLDDGTYTPISGYTSDTTTMVLEKTFGKVAVRIIFKNVFIKNDNGVNDNPDASVLGYIGSCPQGAKTNAVNAWAQACAELRTNRGYTFSDKDYQKIESWVKNTVLAPRVYGLPIHPTFDFDNHYLCEGHVNFTKNFAIRFSSSLFEAYTSSTQDVFTSSEMDDMLVYSVSIPSNKYPVYTVPLAPTSSSGQYTYTKAFVDLKIKTLLESYCELAGVFVGMRRDGYMGFYDIDESFALFPSDYIYPADNLYPSSEENMASYTCNDFMSAFYDEKLLRWKRVYVVYNTESMQGLVYTNVLYDDDDVEEASDIITFNDYNMATNLIINKNTYTAASIAETVQNLCDTLKRITYYPSNIKMRGMPYVEKGDALFIRTNDDTIATIVLSRNLSGIQDLRDNIVSK